MNKNKSKKSSSPPKKQYVDNEALFIDIRDNYYPKVKEWQANGKVGDPPPVTEHMGKAILDISKNFCLYRKYYYLKHIHDELASYACLTVLKYIHNFNPEKYNKPFAYITMIVNNAFLQYLKKETKNNKAKTAFVKLQAFDNMMSNDPDNFYADSIIDKIDNDKMEDDRFDRENEEFNKRNS